MKTATNLQRSNFNNLGDAVNYAFEQKLFTLHTTMTCKFIQYQTVRGVLYAEVVQLIDNIDVNGKPLESPILFNVPINYIMGGNAGIIVEHKPNDIVTLVFSQQSLIDLKIAFESGTIPNKLQPSNYGKFTIQDGILIGKISKTPPATFIKITDDSIVIHSENKPITIESGTDNTNITCKNANITASEKIQATATNEIDVTAPSIKLNGAVVCSSTLNVNGIAFVSHTHSGVTAGTDNTGSVNP